jgi:hypothetical protein
MSENATGAKFVNGNKIFDHWAWGHDSSPGTEQVGAAVTT